jgi:hypothetical protein
MKSKQELKNELHQLINKIEDEHTLNLLNEEIVPYIIGSRTKDIDDEKLTEDEENELDEAIRQADNGETVSWEGFLKATERWHTK